MVNASISGDTTSGGRSRLPALLAQHKPGIVIIELGGNDALRGLPLNMTQANLSAMAQAAKAVGALFYPINPGAEDASWKRFYGEACDRFLNETYAGEYETKLIAEFDAYLPETPPWKK